MSTVLRQEAEESISSGQWDEAIEKLEQLKQSEEWTLELYAELAKANAVRGRFLTVLSVYLEWTDNAIEAGDFEQAEKALGYAQSLRPDSPEVQEMAVRIARHNVSPECLADRLVELAHLHLEKGDGDRAVALVEEAIQARPEDAALQLQLGETFVANGQITSGLKIFEKYVANHSDCGDPSKLREPLQRINLLKPDDKDTMLHLGRVYLALDEVDKAEDQFRAVLKQDLENQDALLELARVCQKKGLFRNGLLALNRVILKSPELPGAHRQMAEIHLAAGAPEKAVQEFLEAARLYCEAGESSAEIEVYRTVLRVDPENSTALNTLRGLSLKCGEDLTANLFPPIEDSLESPDEKETRPTPVAPESSEREQNFEEVNLIEEQPKEKPESKVSSLLPSRPAMVPKSGLVKRGDGRPTLMPSGERRTGRPLREGLVSRTSAGKQPLRRGSQLPEKPFFTREEPAAKVEVPTEPEVAVIEEPELALPPEPIVEAPVKIDIEAEPVPEVAVGPVSPNAESAPEQGKGEDFQFEDFFADTESIFEENPSVSVDDEPLDIPAFTEVFEEPAPEAVAESEVPLAAEEEAAVDSIFNFKFDAEEEMEPFDLFESETLSDETDEAPEGESLGIFEQGPLNGEETLEPVTDIEEEVSTETNETLIEPVDAGVLFPQDDEPFPGFERSDEESIFNFDEDWMAPPAEESQVEVTEPSWQEEPDTELQEVAEEPLPDHEPVAVEVPEDTTEDPMPMFEWELDFETSDEPDASPLFPEMEAIAEPVELSESDESTPAPETVSESHHVEALEMPEAAEPEPVEALDEVSDGREFERLRAAEIALLAPEDVLSTETPELIRILEDTLPQPVQEESVEAEIVAEPVEIEEPIELPDAPAIAAAEEAQEPVEASDVATRIESFRQRLVTFPTDESATLALADTCLRYGLLEEALQHYRKVQKANPSCPETSARIIKAALWMEDVQTVKTELWKAARLSFDLGDLKACQDRLGDLLSLDREHKEARQLMVEVFLAGGQEKLAAWHLGQMVERAIGEQEYDLAIDSLKRLNDVSPSDAALERLAELYQHQHRLGEAVDIFRNLRATYIERNEIEHAVRLSRQVVDLESQRTEDREVLIDLLERSGKKDEVVEQKLELAQLYRQNSETDRSIELLQTVLQENPNHLDAERVLVELHLQNGALELAEQHAESLAERFLEQKAYQKAINLFEYWVGAAPASARARERLAQFYQLNGDLEGAKMEWMMVTESHQVSGDFQRAARSLERALELDPHQAEWRLRLAQLKAQELGQVESALQDFRVLFKADPTWRKATVSYLDLLMDQSRMSELGEVLQEIDRTNSGSDLKDNVVRTVKEKMTKEPDNLELAFGWGELCLALGMLDLAIEQFQRLRRHEQYQLHSYRLLGLCFSRKKGFNMVELALSQFKRGLALEGQTPDDRLELQYARACVLGDHGRNDEAVEQLRLIADEDPNYRDVARRLEELG